MGFRSMTGMRALLVGVAGLLLAAASVRGDDLAVVSLSVDSSAYSEDFVKYTWRAVVHNSSEEAITASLVLTLTDDKGEAVQSAELSQVLVPARSTASFTQTQPIRKEDWNRVVSHFLDIRR